MTRFFDGFCKLIILILIFNINLNIFGINSKNAEEENFLMGTGSKKILVIGDDRNYPPFSFLDKKGNPTGFNLELSKAAAEAMGYEVEFYIDDWTKVKSALDNGEIDMISGMFYSKEREENYKFSTKYLVAGIDLFSTKENRISDLSELKGKTVLVEHSDIVHEFLMEQDLDIEVIGKNTVYEVLDAVSKGEYDYAFLGKPTAQYIINEKKLDNLYPNNLKNISFNYCMAFNKSDEERYHIINAGLHIIKATGEYQEIYDKWLGVYEEESLTEILQEHSEVVLITLIGILILITLIVILKKMVNVRTKKLLEANIILRENEEELAASFEELTAIEEELRFHYDRLLESERNLKKSEEINQAIIKAIPDLLFIIDKDCIIKDCKAGDETLLFTSRDEFLGKSLSDILPERIADVGCEKVKLAIKEGTVQNFKYDLTLNGYKRYFEIRISKYQEEEVIGIARDITVDHKNQKKTEFLSYHDQLTGVYNRRFFEEELLRLDNERDLPFSIVMADVNGLKLINDSFGHQKGDEMLIRIAEILKEVCTYEQIISRIGGDEFVILLPGMGDVESEKLIDEIKDSIEKEKLGAIELSISFGWATKTSNDENIHEVLKKAEDYMYKRKLFEGPSMRGKTIGAIINTLHEKNLREEKHSKRVSKYCTKLARALDFPDRDINEMTSAGLLHDIGKIAIPEELLNKKGKLTKEEMDEVRRHPEIGYRILSSVNDMAEMSQFVLYHHEHWNGKGYPKGLKGEEIPLQARIISIADSYDAMTSERTYKRAMTKEEAIVELEASAGIQFDPKLARIFIDKVLKKE